MINEYKVEDVENWFLSKKEMSPKKLQKLLYYAYSWVLALTNDSADHLDNKLFEDSFKAWVHGPVLVDVYHKYKDYGYHDINKYNGQVTAFSDDVQDVLNQVWDVYGDFSADQLESLTHQETPWKNARKGLSPIEAGHNYIDDKDIFNFYVSRAE